MSEVDALSFHFNNLFIVRFVTFFFFLPMRNQPLFGLNYFHSGKQKLDRP